METDSYTSGPATTDWAGTVAGPEGMSLLLGEGGAGGGGGGSPGSSLASWSAPYSLGFQVAQV